MASVDKINAAIANAEKAGDTAAVGRLKALLESHNQPKELGWGDVPLEAVKNIPGSAKQFASDMVQPILHPIDTADSILDLAAGGASRGIEALFGDQSWLPENEATQTADAVGQFYKDRYGSLEGLKKVIASDPVGVAGDLSAVFTGGGGAAARAPGVLGKAAKLASKAGKYTDPLSALTGGAKLAGKGARASIESSSGLSKTVIDELVSAGKSGGQIQDTALSNLRGKADPLEINRMAEKGLGNLKKERSKQYVADEDKLLKGNKTSADMAPVRNALQDTMDTLAYEGQWLGGPKSQAMANKLINDIYDWDNPASRNPEGLNALRKKLRNYEVTLGPGVSTDIKQSNRLVKSALDALSEEIDRVTPGYKEMNQNYAERSGQIDELERTMSLTDKASEDTTLRKLLSSGRDNVNTNFNQREMLVRDLEKAGAPGLMAAIAGQSAQGFTPKGLSRALKSSGGMWGGGGLMTLIASGMIPPTALLALPAMAIGGLASAPRVVGEAAVKAGAASRRTPAQLKKALRNAKPAASTSRAIGSADNAFLEDAQGNKYDRNGRLIGKRK